MTCPYSEPNCASDLATDARRCLCGRVLKHCTSCGAHNRAFANFCRTCGTMLPQANGNWTAYRGGPRRLGANAGAVSGPCMTSPTGLDVRLGDACRSLLGFDGHLIAISRLGVVEVADPLRSRSICRFQAQGPISAEPCIRDNVLYLGARGQVVAYSLASMTLSKPRVKPLWQMAVNGTSIGALTTVEDKLYVTIASPDWREVQVIDALDQSLQSPPRVLHGAPKVSWLAADPTTARVAFLSESGGKVALHVCDAHGVTSHPISAGSFTDHPIAFLCGTIFAILGEDSRLYRIDASSGAIEEPLEQDTQLFALGHDADDEWNRESIRIDTSGIHFSRLGVRDSFEPHVRPVKGSPVLVQNCAAMVGMEDGRIRTYDLAQLPRHEVWDIRGSSSPITALASFDSWIAAGNADGAVGVRELVLRGAAR